MAIEQFSPFLVLGAAAVTALSTLTGIRLSNRSALAQLKLRFDYEEQAARKDALRIRLEELYQSIEQWAGRVVSHHILYREVMHGRITYHEALDVTLTNESTGDAARLFMLAELYFPACHSLLEEIKAYRDKASEIQADFKEQYRFSGEPSSQHSKKITEVLEHFNEAVSAYKSELAKYARKV